MRQVLIIIVILFKEGQVYVDRHHLLLSTDGQTRCL